MLKVTQKISFNDKYGLTTAVLQGRKVQTRRIIPVKVLASVYNETCTDELISKSRFQVGDVVAIAQSYETIRRELYGTDLNILSGMSFFHAGWDNKMFVLASKMIHHIEIESVGVERLQDISDSDCLDEGIEMIINSVGNQVYGGCGGAFYGSPRLAYAALIDKICGKGTWDENPLVYVYKFKIINLVL